MQDHDHSNHDHHDPSHGAGGHEGGGGGANAPSLPPGVDTVCGGCKRLIEHDNGGVVVAFGSSLFHIDCFRCSKCQDRVTADTNLLLLSDGNPVCSNCSYQCFVCKKPIMDEAIMTGDESYHAACFTCRHCNKRIEELVFAKTSQGIYCMSCHNERVAKSRRHAEAKRKQQRKDKDKEKLRENQLQTQQGLPNSSSGYVDSPSSYSLGMPSPTATTPNLTPQPDYFPDMSSPSSLAVSPRPARSPSAQGNSSLNPNDGSFASSSSSSPQPSSTSPNLSITPRNNTLPLPSGLSPLNGSSGLPPRRSSVDDGSSGKPPMSNGGHTPSVSMGSGVGLGLGLGVPTTKADRRRSINPSTFPVAAVSNVVDASDRSNNVSASSSLGSLSANSHGHQEGRLTPLPPSPLRTTFDQGGNGNVRSPSPSPSLLDPSNTAPLNISSRSRSKSRDPINPPTDDSSYFPHPSTSSAPPRTSSLPDSLASPTSRAAPSPISPRGENFLGTGSDPIGRSSSPRRREGSSGVPSPDQLHFPTNPPLVAPLPRSPTTTFPSSHLGQPPPPLLRTSLDDRQRAPSDSFNVTFGFENDPPRPSISSERGTSPTSTFLAPRQRSTSAVSVDPPRLDAHRPVSFLGDDPDFSSMFQRREEQQQSSSKSSEVPSTPSTGSTIHDGGDGVGFGRGSGGHRSREPSANTDEDNIEDPDITISAIEFPSSTSSTDSISSPARPSDSSSRPGGGLMTSSSSWTSEKPLPTSPSSNFSSSTTDLSVSLNLRARQDSQGSISGLLAEDGGETMKMLKTLVEKAKEKGEKEVTVSVESLEILIGEAGKGREKYVSLKGKYDGIKRASARYIEGLTVASDDYEKEVSARREVETEVKRLRAQMHGQTARLSLMDADLKRQDSMQRRSRELVKDMQGLEKDLSKLRAERDLTLAEVEELSSSSKSGNLLEAAKSSGNGHQSSLSRSLSTRLEVVKEQYREELEPLTAERERLTREINELREARETYLEESTTLNARNEELSDLQASLLRQVETAEDALSRAQRQGSGSSSMTQNNSSNNGRSFGGNSTNRHAPSPSSSTPHHYHPSGSPSLSSLPTSATLHEVPEEVAKYVKVVKPETMEPAPAIRKFKWYKSSKGPESSSTSSSSHSASTSSSSGGKQPSSQVLGMVNGKGGKVLYDGGATSGNLGSSSGAGGGGTGKEHVFMQHNIPTLRFTRCDHCGDKMWGPIQELRCAGCGSNCHSKCAPQYDRPCNSSSAALPSLDESGGDAGPPPPSMFGRDLTEQAEADGEAIPVIVRKCIAAVDAVGMEYEGIYRKTGGSSQSKHITQLFERGDYDAFDLSDQDTFNDISSVTSVLKNYFRALPDPLLTHEFHEQFVGAAMIRDLDAKRAALLPLVRQLPKAHFDTLRYLMLHLNRVMALQKENLMSARNLGVVFGPTLMRSADRSREFGDMAGKALAIDWLVEHAQEAFAPQQDPEA